MTIKASAFLALEATLTKRLTGSLRKLTTALYLRIATHISNGEFEEAQRLINGLDLSSVVEDNKDFISYMTHMAMLFGASRVTPNPGTSVVGMGYERTIADQSIQSLSTMLVRRGEYQLKQTAMQLIAQARKDTQGMVEKANPYHDKLGRFSTAQGAVNGQAGTGSQEGKATTQASGVSPSKDSGRSAGRDARSLSRNYGSGVRSNGVLNGVQVEFTPFKPTDLMEADCKARGIDSPTYHELHGDNAAKAFIASIEAAKKANPSGASVYTYSEGDYKDMRLFVTEGGTGGIAVKLDGDIVSVFNTPGTTKGMVFSALQLAVGAGGRKLDCFDTVLPIMYSNAGFTAQSRLKWDDSQAPDDWDKTKYKAFNNGEPDVVFMTYDPKRDTTKPYSSSEGVLVTDYGDAIALQRKKVVKAERRVVLPFATFMDVQGQAYFDLVSSLHTSRLSAYGFTAEAYAMGYEEYQINEQLDNCTCPVCQEMHGKVFKVSDARALLDVALRVDDPADLKQIQPWPKQDKKSIELIRSMTPEELVSNRWHVPPFHPRCRGLLARVGKAPTTEQIAAGTVDQPYTATREDFKTLGVSMSDAGVSIWNKYSQISPLEVISRLMDKVPDELAIHLLAHKAKDSGIVGISFSKNISIRINTVGFGTSEPFYQNVMIKPDLNTMYINAVELAEADQGSGMMKKYMRELVSVTRDMGLPTIAMTAGLDVGGYAWAKYGFVPSSDSWIALTSDLKSKIASEKLLEGLSDNTAKVVNTMLESSDPESIFVLSDLVEKTASGMPIGKALLMGTTWDGVLDLGSADAMARFIAYIGG